MSLFSRNRPTPLADGLVGQNLEEFATYISEKVETAENSEDCLNAIVSRGVMVCASMFMDQVGRDIAKRLDIDLDVLSLEALLVSWVALRTHHEATAWEGAFDPVPGEFPTAYAFALGFCKALIRDRTGWEIAFYDRRLMAYMKSEKAKDMIEDFYGTVLTMRRARMPALTYGRMSLDAGLGLAGRMLVHTILAQAVQGATKQIEDVSLDYGLRL